MVSRFSRSIGPVVVIAGVLVLAGCQLTGSSDNASKSTSTTSAAASGSTTSTTTAVHGYTISTTPARGATNVPPDQGVSVTLTNALIQSVNVTSPAGPLQGAVSADSKGWSSALGLVPSTTYHVEVTAISSAGPSKRSWDFTTGAATKVLTAKLTPGDGATVGVGMPIVMKLNAAVAPTQRAALESRVTVTSNPPVQGAWHWFSATELHWRPQSFWPAHAQITVNANLVGFSDGSGAVALANVSTHWATGDAHISVVDAQQHAMAVSTNGQIVKLIKVSTGRDKYPTHSGTHVVSEKSPSVVMDSATVGIPRNSPDGYYETVKWDVRISNSGEFVHAAPWSVGDQGHQNVSHGCVNVSTADGEWFYNYSVPGDVVIVTGTPLALQPTNGIGDWQIPWAQWPN